MTIIQRGSPVPDDQFARLNLIAVAGEVHPDLRRMFDRQPADEQMLGLSGHFETPIRGVVNADGQPADCHGVSLLRQHDGEMGADLLDLPAHCRFPLHVHPGHHVLLCLRGRGTFTIGGITYDVRPGDLMMVEGDVPHAVGAGPDGHLLLAIGSPHKPLDSEERMRLVDGSPFTIRQLQTAEQTAQAIRRDLPSTRAGDNTTRAMGLNILRSSP